MKTRDHQAIAALVAAQRRASLATVGAHERPHASKVSVAPKPQTGALLLHLSELAEHTRNVLARPFAWLVVGEPDLGGEDPQTSARVTIGGTCSVVGAESPGYGRACAAYQRRLPASVPRFGFGDFHLVRLEPERAQFVGGFARARSVNGATMRAIICDAAATFMPPSDDPG